MSRPIAFWSLASLNDAYDTLTAASRLLRDMGCYSLAAAALAQRAIIHGEIGRRFVDERDNKARQLSLVPPSAYDPPAAG